MPQDGGRPGQEMIKRYLLGESSDDEEVKIDEWLVEEDFREEVETAETGLIAKYARNELNDPDTESFERQMELSQLLKNKVQSARRLDFGPEEAIRADFERRRRMGLAPVYAAAGVVMVIAGLGLWEWRLSVAQSKLAEAMRRQSDRLDQIAAAKSGNPTETIVAAFRLATDDGTLGGGGNAAIPPRAFVPASAARVVLQLTSAADPSSTYRVDVRDDAGQSIWSGPGQAKTGYVEAEVR